MVEERTREVEQNVREKNSAEASNRAKSEFLARMSHEIRSPINGMLGINELMLQTPLNDRQRRFSQIMRRSAQTLLQLVNDILDVSKIEARKLVIEWADFDLWQEIEDVIEGPRRTGAAQARGAGLRHQTGRADWAVWRRDAPPSGTGQPGRQRHQVHGRRRDHPYRFGKATAGTRSLAALRGKRHRRRDPARIAREDLRGLFGRPTTPPHAGSEAAVSASRSPVSSSRRWEVS